MLGDALETVADFLSGGPLKRRLQAFAERNGGVYTPGSGGIFSRVPWRVDVPIGDALVRLDTKTYGSGKNSVTYMRLRAKYLMGSGPEFNVTREHFLSSIGKAFGMTDVELGQDRAFDSHFVVRTPDPAGTRSAWNERACKLALRAHGKSRFKSNHNEVALEYLYDGARDVLRLDTGAALVGELVRYGEGWFAQLRGLPDAEYVPPEGEFEGRRVPMVRVPIRTKQVGFYPTLDHRSLGFTAAAKLERKLAPCNFDLTDGSDQLPEEVLPSMAKSYLFDAGVGHLEVGSEHVRYTLRGVTSSHRLMAAANVVIAVARGDRSQGAFR